MVLSYQFLIDRADHEAGEAATAVLGNVRDRALRAEAAWRAMAKTLLDVVQACEVARQERVAAPLRGDAAR